MLDLGNFKLTLPEKRLLCGEENQYCGFLCLKPEKPDDILNILIKISPFDSYDIQMLGISQTCRHTISALTFNAFHYNG